MNNPLFLLPIIVGPLLIIAGVIMKLYPPKNRNMLYGYRTTKSLRSQAHWDFAQRISAMESIRSGILLTLLSGIGRYYQPAEIPGMLIALGLMLITFVILILRVENAIAKQFAKEEH